MPHDGAAADPYDLQRFVTAQDPVYDSVRRELAEGRKRSHWMWFVFPQIRGLGHSEISRLYGISSLAEARAYLRHPVLGPRLRECTGLVNAVEGRSVSEIFGHVDALKFGSSMTLFARAAPEDELFRTSLKKYFAGELDPLTQARLRAGDE